MILTSGTIPLHEGQDFYVPYFEVRLDGQALGADVVRDILSVTYKDGLDKIDSCDLSINNWDTETRALKYDRTFDPGTEFELWLGYYGSDHQRRVLRGEITSLRPAFPASGAPTLSVSALNVLHQLRTGQESHIYEEQTDSQIARQIGGRLGLVVQTDAAAEALENVMPYVIQENEYDILFLMQRARRLGYDLFVTEDDVPELYFGPSDNRQQVSYQMTYRRSLIQFQPTLTTANQVGEVVVRGWDPVNKQKIEHTAKREGSGVEQSFQQRREVISNAAVTTLAEARSLAEELLEENAKDMVKATGSVVGLPDLRAGSVLEIDGLGTDRFDGRYFVTGTTHSIGSSGYTTRFECRKEEA